MVLRQPLSPPARAHVQLSSFPHGLTVENGRSQWLPNVRDETRRPASGQRVDSRAVIGSASDTSIADETQVSRMIAPRDNSSTGTPTTIPN